LAVRINSYIFNAGLLSIEKAVFVVWSLQKLAFSFFYSTIT